MKLFSQYTNLIEEILKKKQYIGQCDNLRRACEENEKYWHSMMKNKKKIPINIFINNVNMSPILDDDETPKQFIINSIRQDSESAAYESNWGDKHCMFFQTAGFEFIFV